MDYACTTATSTRHNILMTVNFKHFNISRITIHIFGNHVDFVIIVHFNFSLLISIQDRDQDRNHRRRRNSRDYDLSTTPGKI